MTVNNADKLDPKNTQNDNSIGNQPLKLAQWIDGVMPGGPTIQSGLKPDKKRSTPHEEGIRIETIQIVRNHADFIFQVAGHYKISAIAMAGAIFWEALENPHRIGTIHLSDTRGILGKIHQKTKGTVDDERTVSSEAEIVEAEGLVAVLTFIGYKGQQNVKVRKDRESDMARAKDLQKYAYTGEPERLVEDEYKIFEARRVRLTDPKWAIVYIGAIMNRSARIYENATYKGMKSIKVDKNRIDNGSVLDTGTYNLGVDIRNQIGVLTTLYQTGKPEEKAASLAQRRYLYFTGQSNEKKGIFPVVPPIDKQAMGKWCIMNAKWIRDQLFSGNTNNNNPSISNYLPKI